MQNGIVAMGKDLYEKTIYSSCCNVDKGFTTTPPMKTAKYAQ